MTVLLDVDGVLLDWSGSDDRSDTGFDDFVKPNERYFNWVSFDQLSLIQSLFDNILWHTTWVAGDMCNSLFTPITGFGPFPTLVGMLTHNDVGEFYCTPSQGVQIAAHFDDPDLVALLKGRHWHEGEWWKLNAVAAALEADLLPGKVVWVDDDIPAFKDRIFGVLDHFDATDRFRLIAPRKVWTRLDIEEAADWVES